jgi:peptidyl-prolyl cis-trans isomerase SurA
MKMTRLIPVLAAIGGLSWPLQAQVADSGKTALADGVQAIVNDTVITMSQVYEFTRPVAETLRRQYAGQPEAYQKAWTAALNDSLEQLVDRQLILHSFDTEGYKLPESVIDDAFQERIRERFGDRVTMIKSLQADGKTVEQFRKEVRDQYIEAAMRNQKVSRVIIISPFKVENYYQAHQADFKVEDEVKLRMITLNKNGDNGANAVRLANEIVAEIKKGATFQEMAMVYSQDTQQRLGGERDWMERSALRKELSDAAFALKPGETSGVIDLPDACYLLNVIDLRVAHVKPLADVRADIEKTLRAEEQARLQKQWIESLRSKTFVTYF